MTETESTVTSAPPASSPKKAAKGKGTGAKKAKAKPTHPKTSDMVNAAIKSLKERGGSSLQAIKKYIAANYKVDAEKMAPFIRKYLKSAVTTGSLVQTKGKGASGSFKMPGSGEKTVTKKVSKPKSAAIKAKKAKTATAAVKKSPAVKKSASSSPKKAATKVKTAKAASAPKPKVKKAAAKKPKSPKPKKASKPKAAKKTAAKKK